MRFQVRSHRRSTQAPQRDCRSGGGTAWALGPWGLVAWTGPGRRHHRSALRGRGGTVGNACHGLIGLGLRKWMHDWMGAGRAVQLETLAFLKKKKKN